jgi:site-specific recombinase XerD
MTTIHDYLEWQRTKRGRSPLTIAKYREILTAFETALDGDPLETATTEDVETFANRERRGGKDGAPATIATDVKILSGFYTWAGHRHGWANPAALAGRPSVHNANPHPVPADVWATLWKHPLPTDARVALGVAYFCGLRREEVVRLTIGNVDLANRRLVNFTRKGGGRDVFDYGEVLDFLRNRLPERSVNTDKFERSLELLAAHEPASEGDRLLPWPSVRPQAFNRRLPRWLVRAGLTEGACTPHMLRHAFVTNMLEAGAPLHVVSSLANHASPTVTMRYAKVAGGALATLRREAETVGYLSA